MYTEGTVYKIIWDDEFRDLHDIPAFVYGVYEGEVDLDINGWKLRCHKFVEHREDKSIRVHHLNVKGDVAKAIIATTTKIIKEENAMTYTDEQKQEIYTRWWNHQRAAGVPEPKYSYQAYTDDTFEMWDKAMKEEEKEMRIGQKTFEEVRRQTSFMEDDDQRLEYGTDLHGELSEEERLDLARYCQSLGIKEADEVINQEEDPGLTADLVLAIFKYGKKFDYDTHPDVIEDIMDHLQDAANDNGRISNLHTKICEDQPLTREELRDVREELLGNEDYYKTMYLGYKKILREMAKDINEDTNSSIKLEIMEQIKIMTEAMGKINSLWEEHMEMPGLDANLTTSYPFDRSLEEVYHKAIEWQQDIEAEFGNMVCEGWACPQCHERDMDVIMPIEPGDPELVDHLKILGCTDLNKDVYCSRCNIAYNLPGGGDNNDKTGEVPSATQDDDSRNGTGQSNS